MAEFIYNNAKNRRTGNMPFKLNYNYYSLVYFDKNTDSYSKSYFANKLAQKLKYLILIFC